MRFCHLLQTHVCSHVPTSAHMVTTSVASGPWPGMCGDTCWRPNTTCKWWVPRTQTPTEKGPRSLVGEEGQVDFGLLSSNS